MTPSPAVSAATQRYNLPLMLGLVGAGLAGNYFKYPIFLSIDFLFGSIFAMLALQLCGVWRGTLAAALIASYTYVLWNHPYAIVIMTAEVLVVGLLMTRRNMGMLTADALYWLLLGMPLVYLFYHLVMGVPTSNAFITMTKQAVNGVANALLARLLFAAIAQRFRPARVSLHELLGNLLTAFLLFPALTLLALGSRADFAEVDAGLRTALLNDSISLSGHLERWVQDRTRTVVALSELAATDSAQQMQPRLLQARATDGHFLRLGLKLSRPGEQSLIAAYAPALDESGQANIGKVQPDRAYIQTLRQTLQPLLAEVVPGRIDKPEPIAMLLAPVLAQGHYIGYVNAVLQLDELRTILATRADRETLRYTLLDRDGKVILSNRPEQQIMQPFVRDKGRLVAVDAHVSQWLPTMPANTTVSEQWRRSTYVASSPIGGASGWQLLLEQPVAPHQQRLYDTYANKLGLLLVILLGTLVVAGLLSRRAITSLERLGAATHALADNVAHHQPVAWPHSNITQISQLIDNFKAMTASLAQQFQTVERLNDTLEQRVAERTAELADSEARFRHLFESNSSVMLLIDPQSGGLEDANQAAADYYGYSRAQLGSMLISDINTLPSERIAEALQLAAQQKRSYFVFKHRLASGELRDVEVYSTPNEFNGRLLLFSIVHDVTERQRARQALAQSEAKYRTLVDNSHDIIYTLNTQGMLTFVSPGVTSLLGYPVRECNDIPMLALVHPDDQAMVQMAMQQVFAAGQSKSDLAYRVRHRDGTWRWHSSNVLPLYDAEGQLIGLEGIAKDITERKELEDQVHHMAFYDPLTNLPNRRLLTDRLGMAMAAGQRSGCFGALLFLDLDNFKPLNDAQGHDLGDLLLLEVARRLTACVRSMDTVARFGGDEFVVVLSELEPDEAASTALAAAVAEKIRLALAQPYRLVQRLGQTERVVEHLCSASIGAVIFFNHQLSQDEILKRADAAMYQAKANGRNTSLFYVPGTGQKLYEK